MPYKFKNLLIGLSLLSISFMISVATFEIIGRRFFFDHELYLVDNVDHRNKPNGQDINSDGIRSQFESEHFEKEDFNILFLGDSFVYGWKLPEAEKAFPQQFERISSRFHPEKQINVANFGWVSSSPLLSYRLLKESGHKYNPDIILYCLDMSDFHDDIKYAKLFERKGIYRLLSLTPVSIITIRKALRNLPVLNPLHEEIFGFPADRFFVTANDLSKTEHWFSYLRNNIGNINKYCKEELKAKFVLIILPRSYQYSDRECPNNWEKNAYTPLGKYVLEPFKYFEKIREDVDYPIYSLLSNFQNTEVFPTCFDHDPHWNEDGNRVAAEAIYQILMNNGFFE